MKIKCTIFRCQEKNGSQPIISQSQRNECFAFIGGEGPQFLLEMEKSVERTSSPSLVKRWERKESTEWWGKVLNRGRCPLWSPLGLASQANGIGHWKIMMSGKLEVHFQKRLIIDGCEGSVGKRSWLTNFLLGTVWCWPGVWEEEITGEVGPTALGTLLLKLREWIPLSHYMPCFFLLFLWLLFIRCGASWPGRILAICV